MKKQSLVRFFLGGVTWCIVTIAGICCLYAGEYRFLKTAEG